MTRALLTTALVAAGCVAPLGVEHGRCPCDGDHECCPTVARDQCVPRGRLDLCAASTSCPPASAPPSVAIAVGAPDSTAAAPLPDDGAIPLYFGFQGGFHIYLQLAMTGFEPHDVLVTRRLLDPASGVELRYQAEVAQFVCDGGTWRLQQGQVTYVCPAEIPGVVMHDRALLLEVTLASRSQPLTLTRRFTIRPVCPSDEHAAYCQRSPAACGG